MRELKRILYIEDEADIQAKAKPEYTKRGVPDVMPGPFEAKLLAEIVKQIRVSKNG